MLSLLSSVLNIFTKILPLIFAFKAGRDNAQKKELEQAVKNTQERKNIAVKIWIPEGNFVYLQGK